MGLFKIEKSSYKFMKRDTIEKWDMYRKYPSVARELGENAHSY